ncbi:MAG: NPCBM/NEW2 domain-containing protein [Planctomycetota bacterium]|nr:NPCBM/NEW2 domain-containing protein [Planctomycetota bacterium]
MKINLNLPVILFVGFACCAAGTAQVELWRIDGQSSSVEDVTVENEQVVAGAEEIDINELRLIDFKRPINSSDLTPEVNLFGGGKVLVTSVVFADEIFTIDTGGGNAAAQIKLGVDAVTRIRFNKKERLPLYENAKAKEDLDQLFVRIKGSYQIVPGIVESIGENVKILYEEDVIGFKTEDVYAVILAQDAERANAVINGSVFLTEGSKINCLVKSVAGEKVLATVGGIADIEIPVGLVSKIEIKSNRLAFLSDLGPKTVRNLDGSVFVRKWKKDKNITGGQLVLRDRSQKVSRTYNKGLGTKSGMTLVFENEGFDRFVATIGIDASTGGNGLCRVKVIASGDVLYSTDVAGVDIPKVVDVDIAGKNNIELSIEFGGDFLDLSDHLNWCDARFVKKSD